MKENKVFEVNDESIAKAVEVISKGGVAILPADTVYGFFGSAVNLESVNRVYQIKKREKRKPFVIYTNKEKVHNVAEVNDYAQKYIDSLWPAALCLIVNKKPIISDYFTDNNPTVGVMTAQNEVISRVTKEVDEPIFGTTCNISGEPEIKKAEELMGFVDQVDIMLSGDHIPIYNKPSTIINCIVSPPKIIRLSSLSHEEIKKVTPELEMDLSLRLA